MPSLFLLPSPVSRRCPTPRTGRRGALSIGALLPLLLGPAASARAQAEADPASPRASTGRSAPSPAVPESSRALPAFDVSAIARGSLRLPPRDLGPALGFGFALAGELRYWTRGGFALGTQIDLGHLRHAREVRGVRIGPDGRDEPFPGVRVLADNHFCLLQTAGLAHALRGRALRAWLGLGGGLALGDFQSDEAALRPGSARPLRALARGALGVELDLGPAAGGRTFIALRADLSHPLRATRFTPRPRDAAPGAPLRLYGDTLTVGVAVGSRLP